MRWAFRDPVEPRTGSGPGRRQLLARGASEPFLTEWMRPRDYQYREPYGHWATMRTPTSSVRIRPTTSCRRFVSWTTTATQLTWDEFKVLRWNRWRASRLKKWVTRCVSAHFGQCVTWTSYRAMAAEDALLF